MGSEMCIRDRYPVEMTIILQDWFQDLQVNDTGFCVTLNFGNQPSMVQVPFEAIITFADPSAEFGLRFEKTEPESQQDGIEEENQTADTNETGGASKKEAEIVQLDQFRKSK